MYICVCNGITEREIREFAAGRRCGSNAVYAHFGGRQCGACETHIEDALTTSRRGQASTGSGRAVSAATLSPSVD